LTDTKVTVFAPSVEAQIDALAHRQRKAGGMFMKAINFAGGQIEDGMKHLPTGVRTQIDEAAKSALKFSYDMAGRSRVVGVSGARAHKVLASISGALGGLGGLPTALAELPVATTVIFRAIQGVAAEHGEDPTDPEVRMECLRVFGSGAPGDADDGVDTAFLGARMALTGSGVNTLIARIAPRFATVLSQKLASQTVPILGAAAGAGVNYEFTRYYIELAHVHFGLRQLAKAHGETQVTDRFHKTLAAAKLLVKQA
jgi:hypothetical protein